MNIWKKTASLLLAICLVAGLLPTTVFAAGDTDKAIQLVTDSNPAGGISGCNSTDGYDYIYYGNWTAPDSYTTSGAIKWRVLDTKTNMANATEGDGLFLLSDALLGSGVYGGVYFDINNNSNTWQGSSAQSWCKDFAGISGDSVTDAFSTAELAAILATTKSDESYSYYGSSVNILNADKVFSFRQKKREIQTMVLLQKMPHERPTTARVTVIGGFVHLTRAIIRWVWFATMVVCTIAAWIIPQLLVPLLI